MKIRTKLVLSFLAIFALVGGIGFTFSYFNEAVKDEVSVEGKKAIDEVDISGEMGMQLYNSITMVEYLLQERFRNSLSSNLVKAGLSKDEVYGNVENTKNVFMANLHSLELMAATDSLSISKNYNTVNVKTPLKKLKQKADIYFSLVNELKALNNESLDSAKEFFTITIEPYFRTSLLPIIEEVQKKIKVNHSQKIAGFNSFLAHISNIAGIVTLIVLFSTFILAYLFDRSITRPIQQLAAGAREIGSGNLNSRIEYTSNDELGELADVFNHMAESLNQTTVSRDFVDSIIDSMADVLIVTDKEFLIRRVNSTACSKIGLSKSKLKGMRISEFFKNEQGVTFRELINRREQEVKSIDSFLISRNTKEIPVNISKGVLRGSKGVFEGYVIVAADITVQKNALEKVEQSLIEKKLMLSEIHHRVKNNLAVISGLLHLQMWETENEKAKEVLLDSQSRVQSIAMVHEKLYKSESFVDIAFDKYVLDLIEAISETYRSNGSKVLLQTQLENVVLNINQAVSCSLLLNELVANAYKHAFKDNREGKLEVILKEDSNHCILQVKDDGDGIKEDKKDSDSLGMSLINTLNEQLGGTIQFKNNGGLEVTLTFEIEKKSV